MNFIILTGRLTADPEIRTTQTGKTVAKFSIAVNEGKSKDGAEMVQYFNISAWERNAEVLQNYAKKGSKILVEGRLQNRSWDKPDGTKGYATDIVLSRFEFLGSKGDNEGGASQAPMSAGATGGAAMTPKPNKPKSDDINLNEELPEINIDDMNVQMPF
jgi:single-strand DNA-binding protein